MTVNGMLLVLALGMSTAARAQVDPVRADQYFKEAAVLCEREVDGRGESRWRTDGDRRRRDADDSGELAMPAAERPAVNWILRTRRSAGAAEVEHIQVLAADAAGRASAGRADAARALPPHPAAARLLSARAEQQSPRNGRRPLLAAARMARACEGAWVFGIDRTSALADALAFRAARRAQFSDSRRQRTDPLQEGLAQYTGTVAVATTSAEAVTMVVEQLTKAATQETFNVCISVRRSIWRSARWLVARLEAEASAGGRLATSSEPPRKLAT